MQKPETVAQRSSRNLKVVAILFLCLSSYGQNKPPNCTKNFIPPTGSKDANGKTIVKISLLTQGDYGWAGSANGADPTVQDALTCAIGLWNNAVNSNGQGIPYTFAQIANNYSSNPPPMVAINKGPTPGSPVAVTLNYKDGNGNFGTPSTVTLNPTSTTTDTTLCATMAHELGHVLGLNDAASGTIMGPVVGPADGSKWTNTTQTVQKNDVNSVIFSVANMAQCKDVATTATNHENDSNSACAGSAPNDSCFCDTTSGQYECSCDGSSYTCSDGSSSFCVEGSWQCTSVTTAQCDGPSPCDGAVCTGDNTWDTSQCTSVTTSQCDGEPPCPGATCSADNTWDTSSCNSCTDVCDPSCSTYDYCSCYPSDPSCNTGCDPYGDECDPYSCSYNPSLCNYECECDDDCEDVGTIPIVHAVIPVTGLKQDEDPNMNQVGPQTSRPIGVHPMCDLVVPVLPQRQGTPDGIMVAQLNRQLTAEWWGQGVE